MTQYNCPETAFRWGHSASLQFSGLGPGVRSLLSVRECCKPLTPHVQDVAQASLPRAFQLLLPASVCASSLQKALVAFELPSPALPSKTFQACSWPAWRPGVRAQAQVPPLPVGLLSHLQAITSAFSCGHVTHFPQVLTPSSGRDGSTARPGEEVSQTHGKLLVMAPEEISCWTFISLTLCYTQGFTCHLHGLFVVGCVPPQLLLSSPVRTKWQAPNTCL